MRASYNIIHRSRFDFGLYTSAEKRILCVTENGVNSNYYVNVRVNIHFVHLIIVNIKSIMNESGGTLCDMKVKTQNSNRNMQMIYTKKSLHLPIRKAELFL